MRPHAEDFASGEDRLALEREILRAMCHLVASGSGPLHQEQAQRLERYRFHDATHQVIFDTLVELRQSFSGRGAAQRESLAEHLARILTRKGFPDVDLESLFQPCELNEKELRNRVHRLIAPPKQ